MMRNRFVVAGIAAALAATSALVADERDKKTIITVHETILVPGKVLPPGKYVMKLMNSQSNRNIVQIFNEDQDELQATILAFNNYRLQQTSDTVLTYWEVPAGSPPALRAWFWPGDNFGQEFAYPKAMAEQLAARNNNAKVPFYEGADPQNETQLAEVKVQNVDESQQVAQSTTTIREEERLQAAAPPAQRTPLPESPSARTETTTTVQQDVRGDETIIAQNTPAPSPVTQPQQDLAPLADPAEPSELPRTASPVPLIGIAGLITLGLAAASRRIRRA